MYFCNMFKYKMIYIYMYMYDKHENKLKTVVHPTYVVKDKDWFWNKIEIEMGRLLAGQLGEWVFRAW